IKRAVFDRSRPRTVAPFEYIARQIAPMIGNMNRLFSIQQVTGGMFRRGPRHCAVRIIVSDEEARAHYLGGARIRPQILPQSMLAERDLSSLPILQHHEMIGVIEGRDVSAGATLPAA